MKVVDLLEWGKRELKAGRDSAWEHLASPTLDAEVLLAHVLSATKPELFARLNYDVSPIQEDAFRDGIRRRLEHEPVAYITGKKFFYGRAFQVNPSVLIPRPETELMVDEALAIVHASPSPPLLIDLGVGSGAIGITLGCETGLRVLGSDISQEAVDVASKNARQLGVEALVETAKGNLLEPLIGQISRIEPTNCVLTANLPYLTTDQWEQTQPDIKFEPKIALEAGYYGLDAYWLLFRQMIAHCTLLGENCHVLCEIDPSQETKLPALIRERFPHAHIEVKHDLQDLPRLVLASI